MIETVLSLVFGGASAAVGMISLILQRQRINRYSDWRHRWKTEMPAAQKRTVSEENELLPKLLDIGDSILDPLWSKVASRYAAAVISAVALVATVPIDGPSEIATLTALEYWDIPSLLYAILIVIPLASGRIVGETEQRFLRSLGAVNDRYYQREVVPTMERFCEAVDKMKTIR